MAAQAKWINPNPIRVCNQIHMCTSKVKITESKFMTNAKVTEFLNYSDLDACEIQNHNECEERTQGITPQEEKDYLDCCEICYTKWNYWD